MELDMHYKHEDDDHVHSHYTDWQTKLIGLSTKTDMKQTIDNDAKDYYIEPTEVALKHPELDSIVRMNDDGCIDIFAGQSLGIRLDPSTQSVNIYGENLNFFGKKINMKTKTDGLVWNGHYFNPQAYFQSETERDQYLVGDKEYWVHNKEQGWHWERQTWRYKPMIQTTGKTKYSEGMVEILQNLGLPVE
jgi:hypothetical protein